MMLLPDINYRVFRRTWHAVVSFIVWLMVAIQADDTGKITGLG